MQSSSAEHVEQGTKQASRISKGGLITAVIIGALAVAMSRDLGQIALLIYGAPALALGIRSLFSGMTPGRGVLAALGGMFLGMGLVAMAAGSDNVGPALFQFFLAAVLIWNGFKKGKIVWRKEKPAPAEE